MGHIHSIGIHICIENRPCSTVTFCSEKWRKKKTKSLETKSQKNRKTSAEEMTLAVRTDKTNKDNYIPGHLNKGGRKIVFRILTLFKILSTHFPVLQLQTILE